MKRAIDLFCGAGGASKGLADAGFTVVGVDIAPQPNYPFTFILADALTVDLSDFDFVWASPPCQRYSLATRTRSAVKWQDHPDLIPPTRAKLQASGKPYCIENVVGAPLENPIMLCGAMFGLRVYRHRLFETSFPAKVPEHPQHVARQAKMGRRPKPDEFIQVVGHFTDVAAASAAMGIDWMTRDELSEAIPPIYARHIAEQFR